MVFSSRFRLAIWSLALTSLFAFTAFGTPSSPHLRSTATTAPAASTFSLTVASNLPGPPGLSPPVLPPANLSFRAYVNGSGAPVGAPNWNFGDGSSARGVWAPGHIFSGVGTYLVEASANDSAGHFATGTIPIFVENSFPFNTGFASVIRVSPQVTAANQTVSFSPGYTPGTVLNYSWSFGDGSSSNRSNPVHAFHAGTYAVRLVEEFSGGGTIYHPTPPTNVTSFVTVVSVAPKGPLSAAVNTTNVTWWSPSYCYGPVFLNETFVPAIAGGTPPYSYVWTFGDGAVVTAPGPVFHSFPENFSRTALLTVTDSQGSVATAVVATAPALTLYPVPACPPPPPPPPPPSLVPEAPGLVFLLFGFGIATIAVAVAVVVRYGPPRSPRWP